MARFPELQTERLILRQMHPDDAPAVNTILNRDADIANNVLSFPYPYPEGKFEEWLEHSTKAFTDGVGYQWMIVTREGLLIGNVGMGINHKHNRAGLGYWLDKPAWGKGYTTEAVRRVIQFGFDELKLNRIYAECFVDNVASARVMEKAGMSYEGLLRQMYLHLSSGYKDVKLYAILREEWIS
jgi:RimJ/RimL family protein N-acetyltransferase